jgi:hypothetical protein
MSPSGIADSADPTNLQMIAICCALAFGLTVIIATMMPAAQLARNMADFRKSVIGRRTDQTPGEKRPSFPLRNRPWCPSPRCLCFRVGNSASCAGSDDQRFVSHHHRPV